MRFWLSKGVDGFRVDMASSLVKNDPEGRGNLALWQDIRKMFDQEYPEAALVAEWSSPKDAIAAGFHLDFFIHTACFDVYNALFRSERERCVFKDKPDKPSLFDAQQRGDLRPFLKQYLEHSEAVRGAGYTSLPSGNHDLGRISTRRSQRDLEVVYAFLLTMPGVPTLYYGDEIAMRQLDLPSKEGGYGRTGARTPMQWDATKNAGFSQTRDPKNLYLPLDPDPARPTVAMQDSDPLSLLNHIRRLTALRHSRPSLGPSGIFQPLFHDKGRFPFVYLTTHNGEQTLVALNPGNRSAQASLKFTMALRPLMARNCRAKFSGKRLDLEFGARSYGIFGT